MSANHESVYVSHIPPCDLCTQDGMTTAAVVDGKTRIGPWAYMCGRHFRSYGLGLGLGLGQQLVLRRPPASD